MDFSGGQAAGAASTTAAVPPQIDEAARRPGTATRAVFERLSALSDPDLLRLPLPELLDQTLDRLLRIFRADAAAVVLLDPEGGELAPIVCRGLDPAVVSPLGGSVGAGVAGRVVALVEPLVDDRVDGSEPLDSALREAGIAVVLGVPLVTGDQVLGALLVGAAAVGSLTADDIPVLSLAATHVTLALDHGILLDAERLARVTAETAIVRLERLQRLTAALAGAMSDTDVVRTVVSDGLELLDALAGAVWKVSGERLLLTGSTGFPDAITRRLSDVGFDAPYPIAVAARERRPVVLGSVAERDVTFPTIAKEPAVGTAFVALPLMFGSELLGILSASFADGGLLAEPATIEFLEAVAGQCAVAMHRVDVIAAERETRRRQEEVASRLARLQAFTSQLSSVSDSSEVADVTVDVVASDLGAAKCAIALLDEERAHLTVVRSVGIEPESVSRYAVMELDHHLPAAEAVLNAQPVVLHTIAERNRRYPRMTGVPPWHDHTLIVLPLMVEDDPIGSLSIAFADVREFGDDDLGFLLALAGQCAQAIERSKLREGQRRNRRQLALLAETGRLFAASLDLDATLEQVCRLLTPALVDAASARVIETDGQLRLAAYVLAEPSIDEPLRRLWDYGGEAGLRRMLDVIDAGAPKLEGPIVADPATMPPDVLADVEALDIQSVALLPLRARGRSVGLVTAATRSGRQPLREPDLPFLTELAARVGLAVDNARLFRHQAQIAHTLQRSLLPAELPAVAGAEVAVNYVPGMEGTTVGGDFYDVIPLPSGRVGLVIGDVMGRGVRAAAVMGQLRAAVRSYALEGHRPAALLARLDRLVTTLEEGLLVTCVYGEWDPQRGIVTLASAGHLPPLVRMPGEEPRYLDVDPGVPLGVGSLAAVDVDVELPTEALLVLYTDGIVEARDLPLQQGMAEFARAVADAPPVAADVCRLAVARLRSETGHGPGGTEPASDRRHDDDMALLALVRVDDGASRSTIVSRSRAGVLVELPADASSPARARDAVSEALDRWGMHTLIDTAILLASELVTNAVRHAGTALQLSVHRPAPGRVRVEVTDHAPQAPLRPREIALGVANSAEEGRGLFLVQTLAAAWGSETAANGKTVWFELDDTL